MTPDRWEEIDRVWHAVLARPEPERKAAIDELCVGDHTLRRDVESLLSHLVRASAAGFGAERVGIAQARRPLIGSSFGPYAIHTILGAGGMGEVYQARDSILERDVALKILPDLWLGDSERRARFDREARLLAALNHPNIGSIYGVQDSDDVRALVLELVEGDTLAERLATASSVGRLPVIEVTAIAAQILDALEAAHARGIVHRDLKPANIKITPEGRVKVLDFGLAMVLSSAGTESDATSTGTRLTDATHDGALVGTPAYMSPEQARGRPVDARTDVWAFGCVLYEMLTGARAFGGESVGDVLANVINGVPDWSRLPVDTPEYLQVCVRRCLGRDPAKRFHHVADLRLALEGAFQLPSTGGERTPSRAMARPLAFAGWMVAAIVAAVATVAWVMSQRRPSDAPVDSPAGAGTPPVLVTPQIGGGGTATAATIQAAIDMAARGATISVLPGTYAETITIRRGLILQATGERSGSAVLAPPGTPETAIEIATTEPVSIRGLTIRTAGKHAIRATGKVDVTVQRATVQAVNSPGGRNALIVVSNDAGVSGGRARAVVRQSVIDGAVASLPQGVARPQNHAIRLAGDLDGVIERNMVRRFGAICIVIDTRDDFGGQTNVEIVGNEIDECHPVARVGAIKVGSPSIAVVSPDKAITATGTVNILGNTIRNSSEDCLNNAIAFNVFAGRIERNRIIDFVRPCATETPRNMPGAIWLGLRVTGLTIPAVVPTIRFNDIHGNAHAGLRVAPDQTVAADASCNYWGSAQGPSGIGPGSGDAILVEAGAPAPRYKPFARAPIAGSTKTGC